MNLQETELWNLEKKENLFSKGTKRGLENTVIKFASHNSEGKHKITIRKTKKLQNFKGRLKCKIKNDCLPS